MNCCIRFPSLKSGNANPEPSITDFDPETARLDTVSKSYLETCVRLWQLGDYFQVESMSKLAKEKLSAGCDRWRRCSGTVDTAKHGTTFIVDIESAIRRAWREDLASSPLRVMLASLCVDFSPYVRRHQSFFAVLQEVPQFAVTFSQRAMGSITSSLPLPKPNSVLESRLLDLSDKLAVYDPTRSIGHTASRTRRTGRTRAPRFSTA